MSDLIGPFPNLDMKMSATIGRKGHAITAPSCCGIGFEHRKYTVVAGPSSLENILFSSALSCLICAMFSLSNPTPERFPNTTTPFQYLVVRWSSHVNNESYWSSWLVYIGGHQFSVYSYCELDKRAHTIQPHQLINGAIKVEVGEEAHLFTYPSRGLLQVSFLSWRYIRLVLYLLVHVLHEAHTGQEFLTWSQADMNSLGVTTLRND